MPDSTAFQTVPPAHRPNNSGTKVSLLFYDFNGLLPLLALEIKKINAGS